MSDSLPWQWTRHAQARWLERFPALDPAFELGFAERATRRQKTQIRKQCPAAGRYLDRRHWGRRGPKSAARDALVSPSGAVFIIDFYRNIITVFPLEGEWAS